MELSISSGRDEEKEISYWPALSVSNLDSNFSVTFSKLSPAWEEEKLAASFLDEVMHFQ